MESTRFTVNALLLSAAITVFLSTCSQAQSLIGLWQTDFVEIENPTGHTNKVFECDTAEFQQDGSYMLGAILKGSNGQVAARPWVINGNFQVVDTNHIKMQVSKSVLTSGGRPMTNSYSISGDKLELEGVSDNITKRTIYHRVKK